jgi:hypothetical protein
MREQAVRENEITRMQAWAGQSAQLSQARPAGDIVKQAWEGACSLFCASFGPEEQKFFWFFFFKKRTTSF